MVELHEILPLLVGSTFIAVDFILLFVLCSKQMNSVLFHFLPAWINWFVLFHEELFFLKSCVHVQWGENVLYSLFLLESPSIVVELSLLLISCVPMERLIFWDFPDIFWYCRIFSGYFLRLSCLNLHLSLWSCLC